MSKEIMNVFDLGEDGHRYLRTRLAMGKSLARAIARQELTFRRVFTFAGPDVTSRELLNFETGGKLRSEPRTGAMQRIPNTDQSLVDFLLTFLKTAKADATCVLEDFNAEPHHAYLADANDLLVYEREVFRIVPNHAELAAAQLVDQINNAKSIPQFVGVVTHLGPDIKLQSARTTVTKDQIEGMASRTDLVFAGAYDGESYVIGEIARESRD